MKRLWLALFCQHAYGRPELLRSPNRDVLLFTCADCGHPHIVFLKERW